MGSNWTKLTISSQAKYDGKCHVLISSLQQYVHTNTKR